MTNLEALSASCNYPVDELKLQKILIDRGVSEAGTYTGTYREFELATADLYILLVTSANVTEGDLQISSTDKSNFIKLASGIYTKYGEENPVLAQPKIVNRSNYW